MHKPFLSTLSAAVFLAAATFSRATSVGINQAPLGAHGTAGIANAFWDAFPNATSFSGAVPGSSSNFTTDTLAFSGNGLLLGDATDGRIYDNGAATSWTISAQTTFTLLSVVLQVKTSQANTGLYSPTLNGAAFTVSSAGANTGEGRFVLTYTWSGLNVAANSPLTVSFSAPASNLSVDSIALDISSNPAPAPEPSTVLLLGALGAMGLLSRRRRPLVGSDQL